MLNNRAQCKQRAHKQTFEFVRDPWLVFGNSPVTDQYQARNLPFIKRAACRETTAVHLEMEGRLAL